MYISESNTDTSHDKLIIIVNIVDCLKKIICRVYS